jgi:pyridoxal phosphate enzyme (YggS family)
MSTSGGSRDGRCTLRAAAALASLDFSSLFNVTSNAVTPVAAVADILSRIEKARGTAIRAAPSTTLIAVSKTYDAETLRPVLQAGHRVFGESRIQEAKNKWSALREEFPGTELHLIGPLQTNKVREAVQLFDAIETVDRPKLAEVLKAELDRVQRSPALFIQVNTGEEPQKAGVSPPDAGSFVCYCRDELELPVKGLMCIPPVDQPAAPHFALLQKLARDNGLPLLSMGMSEDFETAIKFGATHVRIGTAIFGARPPVTGGANSV